MPKFLTIGDAYIDLILNMKGMPLPGETLTDVSPFGMTPGGHATNAAVAFSRLNAEISLCVRIGADSHGQRLINMYRDMGIDCRHIGIDRTRNTGFNVIMNEAGKESRTVSYPGANITLSRGDIDDAFTDTVDAVYLSLTTPFETVRYATEAAARGGIPIVIDAVGANESMPLNSLPALEIFSPNEEETYTLTRIQPRDVDSCLRACLELSHLVKSKYYILKLGQRGAFVYDGRFCHLSSAYSVRKVIDTAAVGDVFTAALATEYFRNGHAMRDACRFANAAGAIAVQRVGAAVSAPTADEIDELIRRIPNP